MKKCHSKCSRLYVDMNEIPYECDPIWMRSHTNVIPHEWRNVTPNAVVCTSEFVLVVETGVPTLNFLFSYIHIWHGEKERETEREHECERASRRRVSKYPGDCFSRRNRNTDAEFPGVESYIANGRAVFFPMSRCLAPITCVVRRWWWVVWRQFFFISCSSCPVGYQSWEVGGWGRDPKKCTGRDWGMGSSTI